MRRKSVRAEQLSAQRLVVYADLLRAMARFIDNARDWSAHPLAELRETESDELDRLMSQIRFVASHSVYEGTKSLSTTLHEFMRLLVHEARPHHQRIRDEGQSVDDEQSIQQRLSLAAVTERLTESYRALESSIRSEMEP